MKILMIIFSATGNTLKVGQTIMKKLQELGANLTSYNIADRNLRSEARKVNDYDGIIFGFPIYAWRSPKPVREWIPKLEGQNKVCAIFFTYGGIHVGAAHYDTKKLLEQQGFKVIASAEFVANHTYNLGGWNLNINRPDENDLEVARKYAELLFERFAENDPSVSSIPNPHISENVLNKIKLSVDFGIKLPTIIEDQCTSCGICEEICPNKAIDAEKKRINRNNCIKCFRCIVNCPEDALESPDLRKQLEFTMEKNKLSTSDINGKKSRIL